MRDVFAVGWETAWKNIGDAFTRILEGIKNSVVGIINKIIQAFNGLVGGIESALNWIIGGINAAFGAIQGIVNGVSGLLAEVGIDVQLNMPNFNNVSFGRIPQLAMGGVLTRRTVFEGGEYPGASTNPEIVSPMSLMKSAFKDAMAEQTINMSGNISAEQPIILSLDGDVFYRAMVRIKENRGVQIGGAFAEAY